MKTLIAALFLVLLMTACGEDSIDDSSIQCKDLIAGQDVEIDYQSKLCYKAYEVSIDSILDSRCVCLYPSCDYDCACVWEGEFTLMATVSGPDSTYSLMLHTLKRETPTLISDLRLEIADVEGPITDCPDRVDTRNFTFIYEVSRQ